MKTITKIRFPNTYDLGAGPLTLIAEFTLGLGPCGKTVKELDFRVLKGDFLEIHQYHDDGTGKRFIYQLGDIPGRIEVTYE